MILYLRIKISQQNMQQLTKICFFIGFLYCFHEAKAQQNIGSTYIQAIGTTGFSEIIVGQLMYGEFASSSGKVSHTIPLYSSNYSTRIHEQFSNFLYYPNPVSNFLFIENTGFAFPNEAIYYYALFDMSGNSILSDKFEHEIAQISIEHLIPGIYVLQLMNLNGQSIKIKIIKK